MGNSADRSAPKRVNRSLDHVIGVRIPASQPHLQVPSIQCLSEYCDRFEILKTAFSYAPIHVTGGANGGYSPQNGLFSKPPIAHFSFFVSHLRHSETRCPRATGSKPPSSSMIRSFRSLWHGLRCAHPRRIAPMQSMWRLTMPRPQSDATLTRSTVAFVALSATNSHTDMTTTPPALSDASTR